MGLTSKWEKHINQVIEHVNISSKLMSAVKGKYTSHNKRPDWPRDKRKDHWLGGGNRRAVVPLLSLRFFDD